MLEWWNLPAGRQVVYTCAPMYTVYVLENKLKKFHYTGMTSDLSRRLYEHTSGYSKTTKRYLPVALIYSEVYDTRTAARTREKYLKSGAGREFLKSIGK